jgi:hypothetical protein
VYASQYIARAGCGIAGKKLHKIPFRSDTNDVDHVMRVQLFVYFFGDHLHGIDGQRLFGGNFGLGKTIV